MSEDYKGLSGAELDAKIANLETAIGQGSPPVEIETVFDRKNDAALTEDLGAIFDRERPGPIR
jgi:hypothetical protein